MYFLILSPKLIYKKIIKCYRYLTDRILEKDIFNNPKVKDLNKFNQLNK